MEEIYKHVEKQIPKDINIFVKEAHKVEDLN